MPESFRYSMIVNQKLAFAKIQLDTGKALLLESEPSIDFRLKIHAYFDGAVLELNKALIYFLAEIADSNNAKEFAVHHDVVLSADNFNSFLKFASNIFPSVREFQEMQTLLVKNDSWLQRLIYYVENPVALATSFVSLVHEESNDHTNNMISIVNISSDKEERPQVFVEDFIHEAHSLIDRHRANLEEY
ncbi:MAG: hypothetical protein K6L75_06090 [Cellvibrionaceae bacterium]